MNVIFKTNGSDYKKWYSIRFCNKQKDAISEYGSYDSLEEAKRIVFEKIQKATVRPRFYHVAIVEKVKRDGFLIQNDVVAVIDIKNSKDGKYVFA